MLAKLYSLTLFCNYMSQMILVFGPQGLILYENETQDYIIFDLLAFKLEHGGKK